MKPVVTMARMDSEQRERILQAAIRVLSERGFKGATIRAVGGAARVFAGRSRRSLTKPDRSRSKPTKPDVSRRSICAKPDVSESHPVSTRTVERIVRHAAVAAGLTTKEVNCRTLRRSYAVQCLRDGMDVEKLRDSLGHLHVDSTLAYCRYRTPNRATLWFVGLTPKTGEGKDVWVNRQAPLPCVAFTPAVGTIQCSAP
jgi:integrase